jgi:hypothetical protein
MKAKLIAKAKEIYDDGSIVEVVIWELPDRLLLCKYREIVG